MTKSLKLGFAVLLLACIAGLNSSAASARVAFTDRIFIKNQLTGQCVAIPGGTTVSGTQAIQFDCAPVSSTSRQWDRTYLGKDQYQNSIYRLENVASQLCLTNVGEAPRQTACAGLTSQEWAYDGAGRYHSRTGGCLAVPGGSQTTGVKLILWPCGNGSEQKWYNGAIN